MFASVFERAGLDVRGEGVSVIFGAPCFSSAIASDELLELPIVRAQSRLFSFVYSEGEFSSNLESSN